VPPAECQGYNASPPNAAIVPDNLTPVGNRNWFQRKQGPTSRDPSRSGVSRDHIPNNLDLLEFPTILFYETGYSTYVLRQASRRSWRIGQKRPVRVGFLTYSKTAQESCLRLMGKKLLVSLALEGKLQGDGSPVHG
jgi:hypothetical protein